MHVHYYFTFVLLGDSTCGQRAVYEIGMTGVPVYNVGLLQPQSNQ